MMCTYEECHHTYVLYILSGLVPTEVTAGKRKVHFVHAHINAYERMFQRDAVVFYELQRAAVRCR